MGLHLSSGGAIRDTVGFHLREGGYSAHHGSPLLRGGGAIRDTVGLHLRGGGAIVGTMGFHF